MLGRACSQRDGRAIDVLLTSDGVQLVERLYAEVQLSLEPLTHGLAASDQSKCRSFCGGCSTPSKADIAH